jgi:hypothetical protein
MEKDETGASRAIGWCEWVALPSLGIAAIQAKLDTGASTSALHASDIEPFSLDGRDMLRFVVFPRRRSDAKSLRVQAPLLGQRRVRSSSGHEELRWVVEATLGLAGDVWPIEWSVTARETMAFRLLLGRSALAQRFLVDPSVSYLRGRRKRNRSEDPPQQELP